MKKISLTGIKPTGIAHLGNYIGAIKPAIEFANSEEFDGFYFIADYHALNQIKTKEEIKEYTYNIACTWLACGLNPEKVVFYKQSCVPEILELNWILNNLTPKGLMNRAHAYKAMVEKNIEKGEDKDYGVNMGLYNYPILMSADILMFNSSVVPVGIDQQQHVEIARDIALNFNKRYGNFFTLPECYIKNQDNTLLGLDGRKMSKSYNNTIQLFCPKETLRKTINKIVTDSRLPGEPKDYDCTVYKIYEIFASKPQQEEFKQKLLNGLSWGEAKKELFEVIDNYISPMREKYEYFQANRNLVDEILEKGAEKARKIAKENLLQVKKLIGVL